MNKKLLLLVVVISGLMLFGSLYVGYFGDPLANAISGNLFDIHNAIIPCNLCWYIRIFSYPIFILSFFRFITGKYGNIVEISFFAVVTMIISSYKYYLEMFSSKEVSFICTTSSVSCGDAGLIYAGFITLSLLGIIASAVIFFLTYQISKSKNL